MNPNQQARSVRTRAIVLRHRDMGEADRIVTLLTPAHGKLDVVAHGIRKPTSRKTGHVEVFSRVEVLLNLVRELGTLTQAELDEPYIILREDLTRGAYAAYTVELLDRFTEIGDDLQGLFALLDATLGRLCIVDDPLLALRYYEIQLLTLVGFQPELSECVITGEPLEPVAQFFSVADGGVVSPEAGAKNPNYLPLSLNALKLLRHLQRSPYRAVAPLQISEPVQAEVEMVMLAYITYTLETRLQAVDFIRRVRQFRR